MSGTPIDPTSGVITLTLRGIGVAADRIAERAELEPGSDAALIAEGWATLTPLHGVREDVSEDAGAASSGRRRSRATAIRPVVRRSHAVTLERLRPPLVKPPVRRLPYPGTHGTRTRVTIIR